MNFFDHKDIGNHLLQLCPKVVKHPVYIIYIIITATYVDAYAADVEELASSLKMADT